MRRVINTLSIVTLLSAAVSCVKSDRIYDNSRSEIAVTPVMSAMSKAIVTGTGYPAEVPFGVFASYSANPAGEWISGSVYPYLENWKFVHAGDSKYGGEPPAYWPISGSLVFAGYSPYRKADVSKADESKVDNVAFTSAGTLSITDYTTDYVSDLMYFLPEVSNGNLIGIGKTSSAVPISFRHALALVSFEVNAKAGDEDNILLKEIKILDAKIKGTFTVSANDPDGGEWSALASPAEVQLFSSDAGQTIPAGSPIGAQVLMIPGDAATIQVVYAIDKNPGIDTDALVELTKDFTPQDLALTEWEVGRKYTYTLTIGARKIEASPTVSWQ